MRFFYLIISFLVFLVPALPSISQVKQPNIIYMMSDDMGYGDLSGYGRKDYQTPHLDKLASQGTRFLHSYSTAPICTPTRTGFMTGRYPARTPVGLIEPLTDSKKDSSYGLTADQPSIATLLKKAGYETALIGKWHLGTLPQHSPVKNGFDYFFGFHSGALDYISHKGHNRKPDLYENELPVVQEGYLIELLSEKAISYITKKHNKPFFLALTFNSPHWPWQAPGDKPYHDTVGFRLGGSPATYAAMMKSLDDAVGAIMETLDKQQFSANTLVIFTNDNGGERFSDNGGFSKNKGTLWEGGIRVPAFARWPGTIPPGVTTNQAAITFDWTQTIINAAGATEHPDFPLDGIDLMPVMSGKEKNIERTFYWRTSQRTKQKAIRDGNWKYLKDEEGEYLFDLSDDPAEKKNLKDTRPGIFIALKKKLADWELTVLPPVPL